MIEKIKKHTYEIFILLIVFCFFQYGIKKICGFTLYPDEFGYWASAANIVGYDWSEVASMGSYYSFGYSLILIPVLAVTQNGIVAYRIAVLINVMLMAVSFFLFQKIITKLFFGIDNIKKAFISGAAILYPPWIFYSQMTMAEALLHFLFVLIIYLFCLFIEKPTVLTAVCLSVALIYIYCVHMRTIGVVIACIITLCLWGFQKFSDKRIFIVLVIGLCIFALGAAILKDYTVTEVFSHADSNILSGNDYGSQWGKFREFLSAKGIKTLAEGILGKVFYLGIASFGLFYWACWWCAKEIILLFKKLSKREKSTITGWCCLFFMLAATGEILISGIYMYRSKLIDCLIYGRYTDFLMPIFLLIGIVAIGKCRFWFPVSMILGTLNGLVTMILLGAIDRQELKGIRGYHIAGISYLLDEGNVNVYEFFRDTWILGFLLLFIIGVFVRLGNKWSMSGFILSGIIFVEIFAGLQISEHYTYRVNNTNFEDRVIVEAIAENLTDNREIYYLDEGAEPFVDMIQMQFPKKSIHVIEKIDEFDKEFREQLVITYVDTMADEQLLRIYDQKVQGTTFCLYFNENT